MRGPVDPTSQIVRLRGLPYQASDQDVRNFFKDLHVRAVHFIKGHDGRFLLNIIPFIIFLLLGYKLLNYGSEPHSSAQSFYLCRPSGEAFAEFLDDAAAQAAMAFHKERIGARSECPRDDDHPSLIFKHQFC